MVKPTEFDTLIAMRARSIVGQWVEKVKRASRSREDWKAGWDTRRITPRMDKGKGDNFKTTLLLTNQASNGRIRLKVCKRQLHIIWECCLPDVKQHGKGTLAS